MNEAINWSPGVTLEAVEQQVIEKAFNHYRQNKAVTARSLGIAIRTLESRIQAYEEQRDNEKKVYEERRIEREEKLRRARGSVSTPNSGLYVEPASNTSTQSALPLSERDQVQEVLSDKAPVGSIRRKG